MHYYIPFKSIDNEYPSLILHEISKNIDLSDLGNLNTTVFVQDAFPEITNRNIKPTDLMDFDNYLVVNKTLLDHLLEKDAKINYEAACFITKDNTYHEDYWIIKPTKTRNIISLEKSEYTIKVIDKDYPFPDRYRFTKITKSNDKVEDHIFVCSYLKVLCISQDTLEFIKRNKLKGLSFLEIENFDFWKTTDIHEDHINI
jgi:hypothetical protein